MNNRIRLLREMEKLSRAAFGEKLGVSGDVINNLERGRVEIKEHIIKLICSQFSVNEDWLRNGNEPIFLKTANNIMEQLREEFQLDDFSYNLVYEYLKLDNEKRRIVRDYVYNVIKPINNNQSTDFAKEENTDSLENSVDNVHKIVHNPEETSEELDIDKYTVEELEEKYKKMLHSASKTNFTASHTTKDADKIEKENKII